MKAYVIKIGNSFINSKRDYVHLNETILFPSKRDAIDAAEESDLEYDKIIPVNVTIIKKQ